MLLPVLKDLPPVELESAAAELSPKLYRLIFSRSPFALEFRYSGEVEGKPVDKDLFLLFRARVVHVAITLHSLGMARLSRDLLTSTTRQFWKGEKKAGFFFPDYDIIRLYGNPESISIYPHEAGHGIDHVLHRPDPYRDGWADRHVYASAQEGPMGEWVKELREAQRDTLEDVAMKQARADLGFISQSSKDAILSSESAYVPDLLRLDGLSEELITWAVSSGSLIPNPLFGVLERRQVEQDYEQRFGAPIDPSLLRVLASYALALPAGVPIFNRPKTEEAMLRYQLTAKGKRIVDKRRGYLLRYTEVFARFFEAVCLEHVSEFSWGPTTRPNTPSPMTLAAFKSDFADVVKAQRQWQGRTE